MREAIKLSVRLMVFAMVAAVLLACVNEITKGPIAENLASRQNAARAEVIGEYDFSEMAWDAEKYPYITGLYAALDGEEIKGYVYELSAKGYGGNVLLALGVNVKGAVTGISVTSHSETKGLGTAAEKGFLQQFIGAAVQPQSAAEADAITGATVSSNAVKNAAACALEHAGKELQLPAQADASLAMGESTPLDMLLSAYGGEQMDLTEMLGYGDIEAIVRMDAGYAFAMESGDTVLLNEDGAAEGESAAELRAMEFFAEFMGEGE